MHASSSLRLLALLSLVGLLGACASTPPATPAAPAKPSVPTPTAPAADLRELSGADAELALLTLNERGLPQGLLGNIQLRGTGAALPFRLMFNPQAFAPGTRIELRGRAHQTGRLILRLPLQPIRHGQSQALGELRLVPAP